MIARPTSQGYALHPKTPLDYGIQKSPPSPPLERAAQDFAFAPTPPQTYSVPIPASLLADIDAALDRVDDWDAIERALSDPADAAQQRTPSALLSVLVHNPPLDSELPRVAHLAVLQDEGRRIKRALEVPSLIPVAVNEPSRKKSKAKESVPRRRKKTLAVRKSAQGADGKGGAPKSSSIISSRAEFERALGPLSTQVLVRVSRELERLREAKEKVHCLPGARPPDGALMDVDGRFYVLRKQVPHQHKPDRAGDPSPRCLACALRIIHDRSVHMLRSREDLDQPGALPEAEETAQAARIIQDALGIEIGENN